MTPCSICHCVGPAGDRSIEVCCPACGRGIATASLQLPVLNETVCRHLGSEVKIGTARTFRKCKGGYGSTVTDRRRGLVAECAGCGSTTGVWRKGRECGSLCPGFAATGGSAPVEAGHRFDRTPVPPPAITRTSDRLVITVATGKDGAALHALTGPSQRRYAERIGADYHVLTDTTQRWPLMEKFRYRDYVREFAGGTVCLDADIHVTSTAPDLFRLVPPEAVGVSVNQHFPDEPKRLADFTNKLRAVCRSQGVSVPAGAEGTHWNSGLVVLRPELADYWTPPERPLPGEWIDEELWSKVTTFRRGWPVFDIPLATHWQHWCDRDGLSIGPDVGFIHPAGMGQSVDGKRNRLMLFRMLEALASD